MDHYERVHKAALRQANEAVAAGQSPYLPALDDILADEGSSSEVSLGYLEVPLSLVVGTKTRGRQNMLTRDFLPLAEPETEFATKWEHLFESASEEGLRDSIVAYEYLHRFYVQEGNKRVSVARSLGSVSIAAHVTRVLPGPSIDERHLVYQEFLSFYRVCPLYGLDFSKRGSYRRLARLVGRTLDEVWPEEDVKRLRSAFALFTTVSQDRGVTDVISISDAFLAYLQAYQTDEPLSVGKAELARRMKRLHDELVVAAKGSPISFADQTPQAARVVSSIRSASHRAMGDKPVHLAFVYDRSPQESGWIALHEQARLSLEEHLDGRVRTSVFEDCASDTSFEKAVQTAQADGADLIVTVTPRQFEQTVRASARHDKTHLVNCSINLPSSRVRTFYARMYEVKFLMGALAASLAENHRIGYLSVSPIYGSVCEVNAFALGASMVDPYATVHLEWLTVEKRDWRAVFSDADVSVVAGVDYPVPTNEHIPYGLYRFGPERPFERVALPIWDWGRYYELIVASLRDGSWKRDVRHTREKGRNYWLGMRSGVVRLEVAEGLAEGQQRLLSVLSKALLDGDLTPFDGTLFDQTGAVVRKADDEPLSDVQIAAMSWLAPSIVGRLPKAHELSQEGRRAVEASGIIDEAETAGEV